MMNVRLEKRSCVESLEMRGLKVLSFGDHILCAGYSFPAWYGAVYEFLEDDHSCEGDAELVAVSDAVFEDDGSAIAWAMSLC